jgi:hypothetical protein
VQFARILKFVEARRGCAPGARVGRKKIGLEKKSEAAFRLKAASDFMLVRSR